MNTKIAALLLAVTVATPAVAGMLSLEPLNFTTGFVTSVNTTNGTLVVDGRTYSAKLADLFNIQPGAEVDIWFDNQAHAAAIALKPANQAELQS